ncbi:MAG: hypothetical protein IMY67_12340 [Bacteroidetes bacterium]|nr:hypothetical protein [Bacteroidota bacterium]
MLSAYAFQTLEKQIEKSTKKQIYFSLDNTYHDVQKLNKLLLEDFRSFVKFFFYFVNKIEYKLGSRGEDGHAVKLMQVLQEIGDCKNTKNNVNINIPPRFGKTTLLIYFVAWSLARNPACEFIYTSYSTKLAEMQTAQVRSILQTQEYTTLFFETQLKSDSKAKGQYQTTKNGVVLGQGIRGTITGFGAGKRESTIFSGAIIIDDSLKTIDAFSEIQREKVKMAYTNTLRSRKNSPTTPIINIGQRVHEDDIVEAFKKDGKEWQDIILPGLSADGFSLDSTILPSKEIEFLRANDSYTFASQIQQNPVALGDKLFNRADFLSLSEMPTLDTIIIVGDCAETKNIKNDASAFTCWGKYEVTNNGIKTGMFNIILLNIMEVRVTPTVLQNKFKNFYWECVERFGKIDRVSVENASAGVTLNDHLMNIETMNIVPIIRETKFSKLDRFARASTYTSTKRVTLYDDSVFNSEFIEHMEKITKVGSHKHDDIADTLADAVKILLIDNYTQIHDNNEKSIDVLTSIHKLKLVGGNKIGKRFS